MRASTTFIVLVLASAILAGCAQKKIINEPYPRWGEENLIKRPDNSLPLILRMLSPPESAQAPACVLLVHGMNEYIGRYQDVARYFSQRFIVAGFDLFGHGLSNQFLQQADQALRTGAVKREVSDAYRDQIPLSDLEPMREDLDLALRHFVDHCDENGAPKPVFIVSHSLGSLVTASYFFQAGNESETASRVKGIVLLAPAFSVSEPPGWRGWLQNPFIRLSFFAEEHFLHPQGEPLPQLIVNQLLSFIIVPLFDGLFEVFSWPGLRNLFTPATPSWVLDYLTDSETEKARLREDNWIVRRSLLRYVKGIEEEIVLFRREMHRFAVPYLLIASENDPITPSWGSSDFAQATLKNRSDNVLITLPDMRYHQHLFLAEPARQNILTMIERWLDQRLSALKD